MLRQGWRIDPAPFAKSEHRARFSFCHPNPRPLPRPLALPEGRKAVGSLFIALRIVLRAPMITVHAIEKSETPTSYEMMRGERLRHYLFGYGKMTFFRWCPR